MDSVFYSQLQIYMNSFVREHLISSSTAQCRIYIMPVQCVIDHTSNLRPTSWKNLGKYIRICYLVLAKSLDQVVRTQEKLDNMQRIKGLNISITSFQKQEEIEEHIKMMEKMNESQFEDQYLEMLELLQEQLEMKLIKQFSMKQLHWSQAKIRKVIEIQRVGRIDKFLNYRGFNQLQEMKINGIWSWIQRLMGAMSSQQQS